MNFALFHLLNQFAGQFDTLDDIMEFLAQDIIWIMLAILAALWLSAKPTYQKLVFYAGVSSALSLLIGAFLISPTVNHPRPFVTHSVVQLIPHAADASFPSDHATLAFALAFSVWFANKRWGSLLLTLASLTGLARIFVGVHYPADILGGLVLSGLVSYAVFRTNGKFDGIPNGLIRIYRQATSRVKFKA